MQLPHILSQCVLFSTVGQLELLVMESQTRQQGTGNRQCFITFYSIDGLPVAVFVTISRAGRRREDWLPGETSFSGIFLSFFFSFFFVLIFFILLLLLLLLTRCVCYLFLQCLEGLLEVGFCLLPSFFSPPFPSGVQD